MGWTEKAILLGILVVAVMLHEVAHGLAALACGDPTAKERGRLSLNPLRHIDPVGTLLLPGLLALAGSSVIFGWAKPVPVNLGRTRNPRQALWLTAVAGPATNLLLAALAAVALRGLAALGALAPWSAHLLLAGVLVNLALLVFNLLPVPPLDGSRVVAALLPRAWAARYLEVGRYGFLILFLLLRSRAFDAVMTPLLTSLVGWLLPGLG